MRNFLTDVLVKKVEAATVAGTSDIESDIVDMQGYQSCTFVTTFGTITSGAVTTIKVQQGDAAGGGDMADLEGTGISVADDDDNQTFAIEVYRPTKRYVRCVIDRGTQNAVVGEIYAYLYGGRGELDEGVQDNNRANEITSEIHNSPAEGTA